MKKKYMNISVALGADDTDFVKAFLVALEESEMTASCFARKLIGESLQKRKLLDNNKPAKINKEVYADYIKKAKKRSIF